MPGHAMSGHGMSGHDMSGHDMSGHGMSSHDPAKPDKAGRDAAGKPGPEDHAGHGNARRGQGDDGNARRAPRGAAAAAGHDEAEQTGDDGAEHEHDHSRHDATEDDANDGGAEQEDKQTCPHNANCRNGWASAAPD